MASAVTGWRSQARYLASLFRLARTSAGTSARTLAPHQAHWADKWHAHL